MVKNFSRVFWFVCLVCFFVPFISGTVSGSTGGSTVKQGSVALTVLYGAGDVLMCPPTVFLVSFPCTMWSVTHLVIPFGHKGCV